MTDAFHHSSWSDGRAPAEWYLTMHRYAELPIYGPLPYEHEHRHQIPTGPTARHLGHAIVHAIGSDMDKPTAMSVRTGDATRMVVAHVSLWVPIGYTSPETDTWIDDDLWWTSRSYPLREHEPERAVSHARAWAIAESRVYEARRDTMLMLLETDPSLILYRDELENLTELAIAVAA